MLSGVRVLDCTDGRCLLAGQMLADLGADVVQVEPSGGAAARRIGPFAGDRPDPERSLHFWAYARGKRSVALDLERESGREALLGLIAAADVLLDSDPPGTLPERGLPLAAIEARNPRLVHVSITPFGLDGPRAGRPATDLTLLAAGGPLHLYGDDDRAPVRVSAPQAHLHACADAAVAALVALFERRVSGRGQRADVSVQHSVMAATQASWLAAAAGDTPLTRLAGGSRAGRFDVRFLYPARDGHVSITLVFGSAIGPLVRRLMEYVYDEGGCDEATRDKDWVRYYELLASGAEPREEYERVKQVIADFTSRRTKAELERAARERGLILAPVATVAEVRASAQLEARGYWRQLDQPGFGRLAFPGPFARFPASPIEYRRPAPRLGEHTAEVLDEWSGRSGSRTAGAPAPPGAGRDAVAAAASASAPAEAEAARGRERSTAGIPGPPIGASPAERGDRASHRSAAAPPPSPPSEAAAPAEARAAVAGGDGRPRCAESGASRSSARHAGAAEEASSPLPLAGVRIVDLMWVIAGPAATRMLADWGATVVRIESARRPDAGRTLRPFLGGVPSGEGSSLFHSMNAGKLMLSLDLSRESAREVLLDLVRWADVVAESFAPGAMEAWGLGYEALARANPGVILLSSCLMGQTGPEARFAGFGNLAAALTGFYDLTGWPDRAPAGPWGAYTDYVAPRHAALAVLAALVHRRRTGSGQHVDLSQAEAALHFLAPALLEYEVTGRAPTRRGNRDLHMAPHGVYPTAGRDRWVAIAAQDDGAWRALCRAMGRADLEADPGLARAAGRLRRAAELDRAVAAWTRPRDGREIERSLQEDGVAAAVVQGSADLVDDPQLGHRGHLVTVAHPAHGAAPVEGARLRFSRSRARLPDRAPTLGADNDRVLREILGYEDERITALVLDGALE